MRTQFEFTLTSAQFVKAMQYKNQQIFKSMSTRWLVQVSTLALFASLGFIVAYSLSSRSGGAAHQLLWAAASGLIAYWLIGLLYNIGLNRVFSESMYLANINTTLKVTDDGLRISNVQGESVLPWLAIRGVEEADDVLFVQLDKVYFHLIPNSAFESEAEKLAFRTHVLSKLLPRTDVTETNPPVEVGISQDTKNMNEVAPAQARLPLWKTLARSLAQAFQLALFIRVPQEKIMVTWWQIPVIALLGVSVSTILSLIKVGWGGQFMWYSLPMTLFHLPVLLIAAIFVAYAVQRADQALRFAQIFLMIALAIDLILIAVHSLLPQSNLDLAGALGLAQFSVSSLWLAFACYASTKRMSSAPLPRQSIAFILCIGLIAIPLGMTYRQFSLWDQTYDEQAESNSTSMASEDNFYFQSKALERELAAVQAERKGVTDVFFIGMAGYSGQDVFMKEVDSVARLFRERFDAEGHTIRLVNNNKSLAGSPIASVTSLEAALRRVGQVMNKEEDVLFLFLTSHGSEKHHFTLDLWPIQFKQLDPTQLRKLLDESGIKHRVVVVSACYSGGFINALKDDNTLVISASAPDKTSFGCGNENDWTHFGNAYFNEALRKTYSFSEAFNLAKPAVITREKKEKIEPSQPQMALGAAISAKLALLERQWIVNRTVPGAEKPPHLTTPPDNIEQYVNLVYDEQIAHQKNIACVANMHSNGPEAFLEKNPAHFNGLNKSSTHWPKLVKAWSRYAESYCEKASDNALLRQLYTKHLRTVMPEQDLAPVLKFLASDSGKRWYPSERQVMRRFTAELTKFQYETSNALSKKYVDEQTQIYNEFIADEKKRGKQP